MSQGHRIATVIGARPQFIKAAVVSAALRDRPGLTETIIHTGQHYDRQMSDVFFSDLQLPEPDHHLDVGSGTHGRQTGRMLEAIERVLLDDPPDRVLVYGDTNTTLAAALAAAKLHLPVDHVEAGLRSFDRAMPEEINRVVTDHVAAMLFAPTPGAADQLRREGIDDRAIHVTGDVMYDAALHYGRLADQRSTVLDDHGLEPGRYVLSTIHRAGNTDDPDKLAAILRALGECPRDGLPVVLPVHPRTRQAIDRHGLGALADALTCIPPVSYLDMLQLECHARLVVTDSGGVQKEAYFCGVPCVTVREQTEWTELVRMGWNRLAPPTDAASVARALREALAAAPPAASGDAPYGDGRAARIIAALIADAVA